MLDTRVHYRRKHTFNTRSNKFVKVKTPGNHHILNNTYINNMQLITFRRKNANSFEEKISQRC